MKRNLTKKIISLVLSVLMLSSCWVFAPIEVHAETYTWAADFPQSTYTAGTPNVPADRWYNKEGFGTVPGHGVNGNYLKQSRINANGLLFLNSSFTKLAYCIEVGVDAKNNVDLDEHLKTDDGYEYLASKVRDGASKVSGMKKEDMERLLRNVLGYGYQHDGKIAVLWRFVDNNDNLTQDAYDFAYAYATQILVWELVSGERDENFNRIRIPEDLPPEAFLDEDGNPLKEANGDPYTYISIYDHCIKSNNPLKSQIDYYYNQIETNVKKATPNLDSNLINQNIKFIANYKDRVMEATIPDSNGVFKNTKEIPGLTGSTITHNNGVLKISVPFIYAKEGVYQLPYTISSQVPEKVTFYLPSSSQDLVTATGGLTTTNTTGSITIEMPHHHEWIPHLILPTCTTEGLTCMVCTCGEIYTEKVEAPLGHNHDDSAWVIGYQPTCTEPGEEVQICNRCNAVIDSRPIEPLGHNVVWVIETEASADHNGQMVAHCTKCGNRTETKQYKPHTHTAEGGYEAIVRDASCANDGLMGTFCGKCGVCFQTTVIPGGHSETLTWITTLQPTCTADGESSGYCSDCGTIAATKAIAATGHGEGTWMTSVEAYCGLKGEEICLCDKCGEIIGSRETAALSHDEGVWKVTTDPTCELEGEKTKSCTRCGQVIETEAIAALGHDNGVWKIDIEATADIDGSMGRYCTRCSMVLETKTFTLHTHEAGYQTTLLQNTCTRDGEKGTACKICNAVFAVETVPMMGHDYSDFYMETNGTHSKSCSRCHYVYTENCAYETIESVEATCTTSGYKTHKCTVCTHTYTDSFVPAFGHTMGKWATEGKSTHMRYCTDCGVMEISKHVWGEYFLNNDGDIIEEGSKTRSCIYCTESQTVGKPASIITSTYKATMNLLEFVIDLLGNLIDLFGFLSKILEGF